MLIKAVNAGWNNLAYIRNPSTELSKLALQQAGWAIKYVTNPSEELQLLAVRKNFDAIKFIKNPFETVQEEAVRISYDALRYIKDPARTAELIAIKKDERAIRLINNLDKNKLLEFVKANILVLKYCRTDIEISQDELNQAVQEVLAKEDVEEKYVRDYLNCNMCATNSDVISMDKLQFIYRHGSKKAKKIAVDEKLKLK